jgi:phosphate binding protein
MLKIRNIALLLVLSLLISVSGVMAQDATEEAAAGGTIVDIAAGNPDFSTLVSLVQAAGLVDVLADPNAQWTVFAPTNAAFEQVPQSILDYLGSNPELLTRVLTYHVVEGAVTSDQITESMMAPSMEMGAVGGEMMGSELNVQVAGMDAMEGDMTGTGITVDGVDVVQADIVASNGVIHVIDGVLIPPIDLAAVTPADVTGDIAIAGSSTVNPLTQTIADNFVGEGYTGQISVEGGGTGAGGERFCTAGDIDIWNASRPANEEEIANCETIGRFPLEVRVGTDALAVVVSNENDFVDTLTLEELNAAFSTATTWADIRPEWPAEPIQRFVPGTDSGTYDYFVEEVFEDDPAPLQGAAELDQSEDDNVLVQGVQGSPYAIGFFGYAYYVENQDTLRAVAIDGVEPNAESVDAATYPLARPLFIYTDANVIAEKPQVGQFATYYLSAVNDVVEQVGYFPANERALRLARLGILAATSATAAPAQ